jgi:transcriptional regulator with XRE-family HTH domain
VPGQDSPPAQQQHAPRGCSGCGAPLSRYNPGPRCQACTSAARDTTAVSPENVSVNAPKVRELRRAHGMTRQLLADRAGVSLSYIEKLERGGTRQPSVGTLTAIAAALNVPLDALLHQGSRPAAQQAVADPDTAHSNLRLPSAGAGEEQSLANHDSQSADIAGLMAWINGTNTTDDAIEQIERAAAYLAEAHSKISPETVLSGVLQTHEQVQTYLHVGRQRLRQTRELLRIDSSLLSHACLLLGDLGHNRRAAQYGAAALALAQEAGSDEAAAWSVRAKTARWQERYVESYGTRPTWFRRRCAVAYKA